MNTSFPIISVIVPAYNAEKFIAECVESILVQDYQNIEVLVVDDGSSDNTKDILREISCTDNRLTLIEQNNKGVSAARNTGIMNAKGEYITFCDSDDYLKENHLSNLYSLLNKDDRCQMSVCADYNLFYPSGRLVPTLGDEGTFNSCVLINKLINNKGNANLLAAVWNKLFLTSIIKTYNLKFNETINYGEDWLFVIDYLRHIDQVIISNTPTYFYRRYDGDRLSTKFNPNGFLMAISVRKILADWFPDECGGENFKQYLRNIARINLSLYARKLGIKGYAKESLTIFNNIDIQNSYKSSKVLDSVLEKSIAHHRWRLFIFYSMFSFYKQFTKYYLNKVGIR